MPRGTYGDPAGKGVQSQTGESEFDKLRQEAMRAEMTQRAFEQEIEARFIDEVAGALWKQADIEAARLEEAPAPGPRRGGHRPGHHEQPRLRPDRYRGLRRRPRPPSPRLRAGRRVGALLAGRLGAASDYLYHEWKADAIVAEQNQGGEMVRHTLGTVDAALPVRLVHASRGKEIRAEPIVALFEQHRVHMVGRLDSLERQLVSWSPVDDATSPDALDAMVWGLSELMLGPQRIEYSAEDFIAAANNDMEYFIRKEKAERGE